jgi:hypothetical protein
MWYNMTMIEGIFKFYQDGELIAESKNNITETGRILAIKTLLGALPNFGSSLAIGVGETANVLSNGLATETALEFEVAATPVVSSHLSSSYDYDGLVFKATLSDPQGYRFTEAGLYSDQLSSGIQDFRAETLVSFEASETLETTGGSALPTSGDVTRLYTYDENQNFRIGDSALQVKASGTVVVNQQFFNLGGYLNTDLISLAFYSEGSSTVNVDFYSNAAYQRYSYTGATGYNVESIEKGSPSSTSGTGFDWSNITSIRVSAATSDVLLDAIKFKNVNRLDTNNGLISRTVLPSVITKLSNTPLEIEYYLRLGFNV